MFGLISKGSYLFFKRVLFANLRGVEALGGIENPMQKPYRDIRGMYKVKGFVYMWFV